MKKVLLSFGDSRMKLQAKRLLKQAKAMDLYDEIYICNENNLSTSFRTKYKNQLILGTRGFGYWSWKPQIIYQILNDLQDGDVLQYLDIGCHLNPKGRERLKEYFAIAEAAPSGLFVFCSNSVEAHFSKGDLLDFLGVRDRADIIYTPQIEAGISFIRKCPATMKILADWLAVIEHDFSLINDDKSKSDNLPGFIEHRHDQSIFSILAKKAGCSICSNFETKDRYSKKSVFPIQAKRDTAVYRNIFEQKITRAGYGLLVIVVTVLGLFIPSKKLRHRLKRKYKKIRV